MIRFLLAERLPQGRRRDVAMLTMVLFSVVVISAAAACSASSATADPNRPYAPVQENPYWRENQERLRNLEKHSTEPDTIPRGIFLRTDASGSILIKFANSEQIFRYIIGSGTITPATSEEWGAAGQEVDCRAVQFVPRRFLELNETKTEGKVSTQDTRRPVPSHGRFALDVYESTDGRRALILSADGPREPVRPAIFGFGGSGGGTLGVRYAQIFNLERQAYLGDAVALKSSTPIEPLFNYCWAPDERIAVAYESQILNAIAFEINFHIIETPR